VSNHPSSIIHYPSSLVWLAVLLTAVAWLHLTPIYTPASGHGVLYLAAAWAGLHYAVRRASVTPPAPPSVGDWQLDFPFSILHFPSGLGRWGLAALLLGLAAVLRGPWGLGPGLLAAGVALAGTRRGRRWAASPVLLGLILSAQAAAWPLYAHVAARVHPIPALAPLLGLLARAVGLPAASSQGLLFLPTFEELRAFPVTLEALGVYPALNLALGAAVLLPFVTLRVSPGLGGKGKEGKEGKEGNPEPGRPDSASRITDHASSGARFLLLLAGYLLLRHLFLLLLFLTTFRIDLLWNPAVTFWTFLPFVFLCMNWFPVPQPEAFSARTGQQATSSARTPPDSPASHVRLSIIHFPLSIFLALFCLVGFAHFHDPGVRKAGRILIDEGHSDWEWTTKAYDTEWYGRVSGYNYYSIAEYLRYFYTVETTTEPLTAARLRDCDVLILKTLTEPLTDAESDAVEAFVRAGGGLFLIGDHTNVFGITSHFNPLARRFGLAFGYDATYDLRTGGLSFYEHPRVLPHPIVQNMPPFLFGTSCTLQAGWLAEDVILGYGLKRLALDYSRENFFAENRPTSNLQFGLFLQQAAVPCGRGRVTAFTDSTVFSNFWAFLPGKAELFLGSVEWLNRRNRWGWLRWVFLAGAVLGGGLAWVPLRRGGMANGRWLMADGPWGRALGGGAAGVLVGLLTFGAWARAAYPLPSPHTDVPTIAFEQSHSDFWIPDRDLLGGPPGRGFHTFFVWTQRLGYVPRARPTVAEAWQEDVVVFLNPDRPWTEGERRALRAYVERGGRLLVLDDPGRRGSFANALLQDFGLALEYPVQPRAGLTPISNRDREKVGLGRQMGGVKGGVAQLYAAGRPILAVVQHGAGLVAAGAVSPLFADGSLGSTSTQPTPRQRDLYAMEFWLFRQLREQKTANWPPLKPQPPEKR